MSISKNTPYLIAFDLDGTLLNDKKNICLLTKHYIKKLIKKGYLITISTGRSFRNAEIYFKELGTTTPLILNNGAIIFNPLNSNFKKIVNTIPYQEVLNVYNLIRERYICCAAFESETKIYYDDATYFNFALINSDQMEVYKNDDFAQKFNDNPLAVLFYLKEGSNKTELEKILNSCLKDCSFRFWGNSNYLEIYKKNISKASGIKEVAKFYNIPLDHVICFGDAENDLEMLSEFQNSFLMVNGKDDLKKVARFITKKDNNHNGIYYALKNFFRKNN